MKKIEKGVLYLIPTSIAPETAGNVLSPQVLWVVRKVDYYMAESIRTARRFISELNNLTSSSEINKPITELEFVELSKSTRDSDVKRYLEPVLNGRDVGVLSEAGCPGVADPGALAVKYAHEYGIKVVPLVGPSSILLALMASGFNGQSFAFHGYLPIPSTDRAKKIKTLEQDSIKNSQTQIFMETPYRNDKLLQDILNTCNNNTLLCIASNISGSDENIVTKTVSEWKKESFSLHKIPAIFLIYGS